MSKIQLLLIVHNLKKNLEKNHKVVLIEEINFWVNVKNAHSEFV